MANATAKPIKITIIKNPVKGFIRNIKQKKLRNTKKEKNVLKKKVRNNGR
jgi:hypothetical protein